MLRLCPMRRLSFNTGSKFLSLGFSTQFRLSKIFSEDVRRCASNSIDSFLRAAIASRLLRICLSGFHLTNAEAGNGLACRVYMDLVLYPSPRIQKAKHTRHPIKGGWPVHFKEAFRGAFRVLIHSKIK